MCLYLIRFIYLFTIISLFEAWPHGMFNELYAHPVVIFDFEIYIKCNDSCMGKAKYIHLICINEKDELFITKNSSLKFGNAQQLNYKI